MNEKLFVDALSFLQKKKQFFALLACLFWYATVFRKKTYNSLFPLKDSPFHPTHLNVIKKVLTSNINLSQHSSFSLKKCNHRTICNLNVFPPKNEILIFVNYSLSLDQLCRIPLQTIKLFSSNITFHTFKKLF